jgi:hypothetical protein
VPAVSVVSVVIRMSVVIRVRTVLRVVYLGHAAHYIPLGGI